MIKEGFKWVAKKAIGPVGVVVDALTPVKGSISTEEKQYLIKDQKDFSEKNRANNIKKSIADTKSKTLDLSNNKPAKISLSNKVADELSKGVYYDGDKQAMIYPETGAEAPASKIKIGDLNKLDESVKTIDNTKKIAAEKIKQNISPNDKKILDGLKQKLSSASKATFSTIWGAAKKHPKIATLSSIVGSATLYTYLTGEEENKEDNSETEVNQILSGPGGVTQQSDNMLPEIETGEKKETTKSQSKEIDFKPIIETKKLPQGVLPYQFFKSNLGINWNADNRDKIDEVLTKNLLAELPGSKGSAERNIAIVNILNQIKTEQPEMFKELTEYVSEGLSI